MSIYVLGNTITPAQNVGDLYTADGVFNWTNYSSFEIMVDGLALITAAGNLTLSPRLNGADLVNANHESNGSMYQGVVMTNVDRISENDFLLSGQDVTKNQLKAPGSLYWANIKVYSDGTGWYYTADGGYVSDGGGNPVTTFSFRGQNLLVRPDGFSIHRSAGTYTISKLRVVGIQ